MDIKNLVERSKKGDISSFESLIEKYKIYLYNIGNAILKNEDDIGDAISETIIKAYKYLNKLKDATLFKTWITKIFINESRKILKKRKYNVDIEEGNQEISINNIENNEIKLDVISAINLLKKEEKDIIILFYYNDLKISEIATILQLPEGTVKSRMNTARKKLMKVLKR